MKTVYPTEQLSFNEWAAYIKSEQMKHYSHHTNQLSKKNMFYKFYNSEGVFNTALNSQSLEQAKDEFISLWENEWEYSDLVKMKEASAFDFFSNVGLSYEISSKPFSDNETNKH